MVSDHEVGDVDLWMSKAAEQQGSRQAVDGFI